MVQKTTIHYDCHCVAEFLLPHLKKKKKKKGVSRYVKCLCQEGDNIMVKVLVQYLCLEGVHAASFIRAIREKG